jgi:Uma2 family endonuclease
MTADALPTAPPPTGWTVADLEKLPESGLRYELVDGVPVVMAPAQLRHNHAQVVLLTRIAEAAPAGYHVGLNVGIVLADDQCPLPDVVVLRGVSPDDQRNVFPAELAELVSEVVSPSTRATDRFRKPAQYAQAGIGVYLRVELDPLHAVAYEIGEDGLYVEAARAEPGRQLRLARPFPVSFDPAVLLR